MSERTIDEILLLGVQQIEKEHKADYDKLQERNDEYVDMCGSFFDYLRVIGRLDDFSDWISTNVHDSSSKERLYKYIKDLSENFE